MMKRFDSREDKGVSQVVAMILLLTIIFVITSSMILWGASQISTLQKHADYESASGEMDNFNEKIAAMTIAGQGNTEVGSFSVSGGDFAFHDKYQSWGIRYETTSSDIREDLEDMDASEIVPQADTGQTISDGRLVLAAGTMNMGFSTFQGDPLYDLRFEADVQITQSTNNNDWIGVHVRMANPSDSPIVGGYTLMYDWSGRLIIAQNGVVIATKNTIYSPADERHIEVVVFDKNITLRVGDTAVSINNAVVSSGYVSICVGGVNVKGAFDNIVLHPTGFMAWDRGLGGDFQYRGSGDYIKVTLPDNGNLDWWDEQGMWHYRLPVNITMGDGELSDFPVDVTLPLSTMVPPGEKLDRNSIRVVAGDTGDTIPYQAWTSSSAPSVLSPSTTGRVIDLVQTSGSNNGGGVLATDGKYLYIKRWGTLQGSTTFQIYGTGFGGTERGRYYGDISGTYRTDTVSAFYLNGRLYNGYTPDGNNLQYIDPSTGDVDYLPLSSPLCDRTTGADLSAGSSNLMLTTDGRYIYCVSTGIGGSPGGGYRVKMYSPDGTLIYEWSKTVPSVVADGVVCDGSTMSIISNANMIVRFTCEPGHFGDTYVTWVFPGNDGGMAGGQYDNINMLYWLSNKQGSGFQGYEGPAIDTVSWVIDGITPPHAVKRYYIYYDTYSNGFKENIRYTAEKPPSVEENNPLSDYTLENSVLRVSVKEGAPPSGSGYDHIYEIVDKRTGRSLMNSQYNKGWMVSQWNYAGFTESPFNGVTHIIPVSSGPVFAKVKMILNYTGFLYERYYTIYRDSPLIKIDHVILAKANIASTGQINMESWWCPGRGDNQPQQVDSAYGMGGHDFGGSSNNLGAEYTSQEYLGWNWRIPSVQEKSAAWFAHWNETNGDGIGSIWTADPTLDYMVYASPNAASEGMGLDIQLRPPAMAAGSTYSFTMWGYAFTGENGEAVSEMADGIHSLALSVGSVQDTPYLIMDIDSYPFNIHIPESYSVIRLEVYQNSSLAPMYGADIYSLDAVVRSIQSATDMWRYVIMNGGAATDYPSYRWHITRDLMLSMDPETGTFTIYFIQFNNTNLVSGGKGNYFYTLKMAERQSFVTTNVINFTINIEGNLSDIMPDYLVSSYSEYLHKAGLYTEYQGLLPVTDFYGTETVGFGGYEKVTLKFVVVREDVTLSYTPLKYEV